MSVAITARNTVTRNVSAVQKQPHNTVTPLKHLGCYRGGNTPLFVGGGVTPAQSLRVMGPRRVMGARS